MGLDFYLRWPTQEPVDSMINGHQRSFLLVGNQFNAHAVEPVQKPASMAGSVVLPNKRTLTVFTPPAPFVVFSFTPKYY